MTFVFQVAQAFDPVPIDEFFKRYPDEKREVQEFFKDSERKITSEHDIVGDIISRSMSEDKDGPELREPEKVKPRKENVKINKLKNAQILVLNRISGERTMLDFIAGEEKYIDNFRIIVSSCQKRMVNRTNQYTAVAFRVFDTAKNQISPLQAPKAPTEKNVEDEKDKLIFSNHIYIELPGLNGFEHPIYDIRPLSCS